MSGRAWSCMTSLKQDESSFCVWVIISCVLCFALVNTYSSNEEETTLTEMLDVPRWYRFDVSFGRARYYACSCSVTSRVCGASGRLLPSNCFLLLNKVIASGGFIKHKSTSTCQTVMFHYMIYDHACSAT